MPHGYVIAHIDVTHPEQMAEYRQWSTAAAQTHGGEFIVRGGQQQVLEGTAFARTVVLRFPSYAQALAFYDSPEYRHARQVREGAGVFNLLCVEGVD
ncbi:MAG: DUF1330 domain-containing protein [Pseudomonadota bacterium]|nr:DUF1330 domain-containing protein [Pseudomonadota bacterium]